MYSVTYNTSKYFLNVNQHNCSLCVSSFGWTFGIEETAAIIFVGVSLDTMVGLHLNDELESIPRSTQWYW